MPRRHRREEHENNERWLVSYADFITLLLALFVVMYAFSQVNGDKNRVLAESLSSALASQPDRRTDAALPQVPAPAPAPSVPLIEDRQAIRKARHFAETQRRQQERMESIAHDIMSTFAPLVENGQVRVIQSNRGLGVEINASVLFAPGQAVVQENSSRLLEAIAQVLKNDDYAIQVEGHTDNIPITGKFPSNWELSAVRASSVVRLLIDNGVEAARLTAVGHGENLPVDSNDSEEGRMRNRRVTVMILSSPPEPLPETLPEIVPEDLPGTLPDNLHLTGVKPAAVFRL
ncbi:flagellar motor protein MotD [Nitrosospira briensis]|uniref:flagellar motor protein MotD n=1 Tax=Nitrosospira briensis TaxID=35799 RepID=UPI0008E81414|nr:flagellar motor protein MotD [Nitrosospira briensis]SFN70379.1 chemotaxis protein MotB [Nitrosospira briensis]